MLPENCNFLASPNHFNHSTNLNYRVQETGHVLLVVYDINGRLISHLVDGLHSAGVYSVEFNAEGLSSGVYFVRMETEGFRQTQKLLLIK